ncbi:MAG: S26 family signal peptidase [Vitreimonas sp.]
MRWFVALTGLFCIAASCALTPGKPWLIYNGSPSVPIGFYVRSTTRPSLGAFVTVRAAAVASDYAHVRQFDGSRDWFIKRVAATAGSLVCAREDHVDVGRVQLARLERDRAGRPLPQWRECRTLRRDEFFLAGDSVDSFDSRYWGPVHADEIEGVWTPLYPTQGKS